MKWLTRNKPATQFIGPPAQKPIPVQQIQDAKNEPKIQMDIPIETLASLTAAERAALVRLTLDEGFPVLVKVFNAICYEATCRLVTCAPENHEQVAALHTEARCKHEFTTRMIGILRHLNSLQIPKANPQGEEDARTAGIYSNARPAN